MKANLIKGLKLVLLNVKWIMLVILLLNMFPFGYWKKMNEQGLCSEEEFWAVIIVVTLVLFFIFDRVWKKIVNKVL